MEFWFDPLSFPRRNFLNPFCKRIHHTPISFSLLDLIAPKPTTANARRRHQAGHLRLIQGFLQSDSNPFSNGASASSDSNPPIKISALFDELLESKSVDDSPSRIDASVLSQGISSCGSSWNLHRGVQLHCAVIRSGFAANVYIGSSLVSMYCRCSELQNAYQMFDEMPLRNLVSWTAIISGFAQEWQVDVCLRLFSEMRNSAKPNEFTFASILSACTRSRTTEQS